ncbi:MAG: xylose isomerase, partial [Sphaerochaetaceae bacterium]
IERMRQERYASFDSGDGKLFEEGKLSLTDLAEIGRKVEAEQISGQQELYYNLVNQYLFNR